MQTSWLFLTSVTGSNKLQLIHCTLGAELPSLYWIKMIINKKKCARNKIANYNPKVKTSSSANNFQKQCKTKPFFTSRLRSFTLAATGVISKLLCKGLINAMACPRSALSRRKVTEYPLGGGSMSTSSLDIPRRKISKPPPLASFG